MTLEEYKGRAITTETLVKWTGIVMGIVSAIISVTVAYMRHDSRLSTLDLLTAANSARIESEGKAAELRAAALDRASDQRDQRQQRELDSHELRLATQDHVTQELLRKMDVQTTILDRIDKQLKTP
jgi:hypothetical protein